MITRAAIQDRVREWGLREDVVEKDYVLGWLLWGIGSDPTLGDAWVFKGGTCLKKCYIETYRFSEDLDFTVLPGGPVAPADVEPALGEVLRRVGEEAGIDFAVRAPVLRARPSGRSGEGRVYYRGPLGAPNVASIKLDLTADEAVVQPTVLRTIAHPHEDALPAPGVARCYSFEEVFAEKLRALGERSRPRDLYDVVNLYRRGDLRAQPALIRDVLAEKCRSKGVPMPTHDALLASPNRPELESEWANMLAHQLPALPPFGDFWHELEAVFAWLGGASAPAELPAVAADAGEDAAWRPPPTAWTWGAGVPLEAIRFAGANRLCVELRYQGSSRLIEPYALRRTRDGNLLLHAIRVDNRQSRSYRVDRMQGVRVTDRVFRPTYAIEFAQSGPIAAPPVQARAIAPRWPSVSRSRRARSAGGPRYVVQCPRCDRQFERSRYDVTLRAHKDRDGYPCYGRHGYLVDTRY